jgi:hypothetical protein
MERPQAGKPAGQKARGRNLESISPSGLLAFWLSGFPAFIASDFIRH